LKIQRKGIEQAEVSEGSWRLVFCAWNSKIW